MSIKPTDGSFFFDESSKGYVELFLPGNAVFFRFNVRLFFFLHLLPDHKLCCVYYQGFSMSNQCVNGICLLGRSKETREDSLINAV
jgi:hypothetical protein